MERRVKCGFSTGARLSPRNIRGLKQACIEVAKPVIVTLLPGFNPCVLVLRAEHRG